MISSFFMAEIIKGIKVFSRNSTTSLFTIVILSKNIKLLQYDLACNFKSWVKYYITSFFMAVNYLKKSIIVTIYY